jgi:hypothetical protein
MQSCLAKKFTKTALALSIKLLVELKPKKKTASLVKLSYVKRDRNQIVNKGNKRPAYALACIGLLLLC